MPSVSYGNCFAASDAGVSGPCASGAGTQPGRGAVNSSTDMCRSCSTDAQIGVASMSRTYPRRGVVMPRPRSPVPALPSSCTPQWLQGQRVPLTCDAEPTASPNMPATGPRRLAPVRRSPLVTTPVLWRARHTYAPVSCRCSTSPPPVVPSFPGSGSRNAFAPRAVTVNVPGHRPRPGNWGCANSGTHLRRGSAERRAAAAGRSRMGGDAVASARARWTKSRGWVRLPGAGAAGPVSEPLRSRAPAARTLLRSAACGEHAWQLSAVHHDDSTTTQEFTCVVCDSVTFR